MINVNLIYPIGSIYMSINNKNPSDIFGGTWERIKGKMLVGVDENDADFNESSKTGGEKEVTLTVEQIPPHNHSLTAHGSDGTGNMVSQSIGNGGSRVVASWVIGNTGGGQPHNNMPPYYTVYIFVRTA